LIQSARSLENYPSTSEFGFKWGVSKIRHGENGGNATLLGQIIDEPKK
jgi:hypothetical protein